MCTCERLDKKYRVLFIASQPKIHYWQNEELPKDCLNESSGKQAVIDLLITIGKSDKIDRSSLCEHAGIIKIAKIRRGSEGVKSAYIKRFSGRFEEIDKEEYMGMKQF